MDAIFMLLLALALDMALGEPTNRWHPVAWLGKLISGEMKLSPQNSPIVIPAKAGIQGKGEEETRVRDHFAIAHGELVESMAVAPRQPRGERKSMVLPFPKQPQMKQFVFGTVAVLLTVTAFAAVALFLMLYLRQTSQVIYILVGGILLKFTFSLRGLRQAVNAVRNRLSGDNLAEARASVKALVGRNTADLDKSQLISAAVESVAENSTDSFVAPLFYFALFGVPGAASYRVINTFDSMIGHRGEWEYLGKFAARLDTVANFIPARLSGLMLVAAAWLSRNSPRRAWQVMLRDRGNTASPNAGWTMSAMAGALGVRLEKTGYYRLGDNRNALSLSTIDVSRQMVMILAAIWSAVIVIAEVIYIAAT